MWSDSIQNFQKSSWLHLKKQTRTKNPDVSSTSSPRVFYPISLTLRNSSPPPPTPLVQRRLFQLLLHRGGFVASQLFFVLLGEAEVSLQLLRLGTETTASLFGVDGFVSRCFFGGGAWGWICFSFFVSLLHMFDEVRFFWLVNSKSPFFVITSCLWLKVRSLEIQKENSGEKVEILLIVQKSCATWKKKSL